MPSKPLKKMRADELVAAQSLARSRSQAQALIMAGEVFVEDCRVKKAGEMFPPETVFTIKARRRFVSRGGFKLEGALADLKVDPAGMTALDVGASTGGFTDCLLQHGALSVAAVDVGRNLLDWSLRQDPRVTSIEGVNARDLEPRLKDQKFDIAVIDVSFISLGLIVPQVAPLIKNGGHILAMVKPQFEVGREKVGKKGVVRVQAYIDEAVDKIAALAPGLSPPFIVLGKAESRLPGPEGNLEVFLHFTRQGG